MLFVYTCYKTKQEQNKYLTKVSFRKVLCRPSRRACCFHLSIHLFPLSITLIASRITSMTKLVWKIIYKFHTDKGGNCYCYCHYPISLQ